jgi:hypothetical protein
MSRYLRDAPVYTIMPAKPVSDGLTTQPAPLDPTQGATPPTGTPGATGQPAVTSNPLGAVSGLLDQSVFGIPVKYLVIGAALWFFLKK